MSETTMEQTDMEQPQSAPGQSAPSPEQGEQAVPRCEPSLAQSDLYFLYRGDVEVEEAVVFTGIVCTSEAAARTKALGMAHQSGGFLSIIAVPRMPGAGLTTFVVSPQGAIQQLRK